MPILPPNPELRKMQELQNEMLFQQLDSDNDGKISANDKIDKAILQELGIIDKSGKDTGKTISKSAFVYYFSGIANTVRNVMNKKQKEEEKVSEQQKTEQTEDQEKTKSEILDELKLEREKQKRADIDFGL